MAIATAIVGTLSAVAAVWLSMTSQHATRKAEELARSASPAGAAAVIPSAAPAVANAVANSAASGAPPAAASPGVAPPAPAAPATAVSTPAMPSPVAAYARVEARRADRDCPPSATLLFAFDSAKPSTGDFGREGGALLDWLRAHPQARLAVQGHADAVGTDQHNLILSYQRARAASAVLARAGVDPVRVALSAAGSHALIDGLPAGAKENRRAVVSVKGYEDCESNAR